MLTENSVPEIRCHPASTAAVVLAEQEKNYYCQRCLNHGELKPRKGHKPECGYLKCPCEECTMVEKRRYLNNMLSKTKVRCENQPDKIRDGKRVRDPHCARCSAHGVMVPLKGHKKTNCQFTNCRCKLCVLVENRRHLMAAQIKLRRNQQKTRDGTETKTKRVRRAKDIKIVDPLNQLMMVVTTQTQKITGTSTSPSPSSTTDTMSPSLSISPPPSPKSDFITQTPPTLAAPIPVYPAVNSTQFLQQHLLLNYLNSLISQQQAPPPVPLVTPTTFMVNDQLGAALCNIYLKGCLKI